MFGCILSLGKRNGEDLDNFSHLSKHAKQYRVEKCGLVLFGLFYFVNSLSPYRSQERNLLCYVLGKSNSRGKKNQYNIIDKVGQDI